MPQGGRGDFLFAPIKISEKMKTVKNAPKTVAIRFKGNGFAGQRLAQIMVLPLPFDFPAWAYLADQQMAVVIIRPDDACVPAY